MEDVLFEEMSGSDGDLGIITLNRPQALNSLNHKMVLALHTQLQKWALAKQIKAVVIRAAPGRAFCAGGDLRLIYTHKQTNDPAITRFFYDEYQLNRFIFHYPKPYIALLDGITMGGGVGISIHGSHRVATDRLMFAMPETGIGFFPDVGGSYFLPRLSGYIGFYIALSGIKLTSEDCVALNIAQWQVSPDSISNIVNALAQHPFQKEAHAAVSEVLNEFKVDVKESLLMRQQATIDDCFSLQTMEDILQALQKNNNAFCEKAIAEIAKKSPTSLKITLRALQEGSHLDFDACMRQEYRLTCRFVQEHDFLEGIRALIIDKDQKTVWQPPTLDHVTIKQVEKYFSPLEEELV